MFSTDDTIVAIATPQGRGGLGVVRLSGPAAVAVAGRLIDRRSPLEPRHATFARVVEPTGESSSPRAVDEVVVTWFAAPQSYTGENVVELSGHGSPILLERIVTLAIGHGARLAEPGEFTLRAYLHGRIDLVQAEAVADLIEAVTPRQARAAMDQLEGTLTSAISRADVSLFELSARLEASLDFPDEGYHFISGDELAAELGAVRGALDLLSSRGRSGRLIREGRCVVIAGRPNTGKSSLFNALVGSARAIVMETPGTTRDLITERVDIHGVPIRLVDTAGVRDAVDNVVEAEGVRRAEQARDVAELLVIVLDGSAPLTDDDYRLLGETTARPRVLVANKSDLPHVWDDRSVNMAGAMIRSSALTGEGLDDVRRELVGGVLDIAPDRDEPFITNVRHLTLVNTAREALQRAEVAQAAGAPEELVVAEIGDARRALEEITGQRTTDDVLHHIFSKFCIGK